MMELKVLTGRVAILEKLVAQIANWTKFDLQEFAESNPKNNDDDDEDEIEFKYLIKGRPGRKTGTKNGNNTSQPSTRSGRQSGRSHGGKSSKSTARKSTAGPSQRLSPRSRSKVSSTTSTLPKDESDVGFSDIDVKMEPSFEVDKDDGLEPDDDFIFGGGPSPYDPGHQDSDTGSDYQFQPTFSNASSSPGSGSGSGDEREDDDDDKKTNRRKRSGIGNRKRNLGHSGQPRYRNCAPLRVPPAESVTELNPLIKMDQLSQEELARMNVTIPKGRKPIKKGPHPCPKCDQVFRTRRDFYEHRKTHSRTRTKKAPVTWPCPHCPRTYHHKCKLAHHMKTHSGERPFLCYHCGHTSKCLSSLNSHISLIHPSTPREKNIKCEKCDKLFLSRAGLFKHHKKDHGENGRNELEAACHLCTLFFSDPSKLQRHIEDVHEDKRRYSCHLCGQMFKRPNHLQKHVERHDNPNRRKRGQQKPMIRGQLIPQPADDPLAGCEPQGSEEGPSSLPPGPPPPDKEIKTSPTKLVTDFNVLDLHQDQGHQGQPLPQPSHFQIQIQPGITASYSAIDQNIVKDFTLSYLQ